MTKENKQVLNAIDLFNSLRNEDENKNDTRFVLKEHSGLKAIINGYKEAYSDLPKKYSTELYHEVCKSFISSDFTAKEITAFSLVFSDYQKISKHWYKPWGLRDFDYFSGFYFSALINNCHDNEIVLDMRYDHKPIVSLGFRNEKNIIINGDSGPYLGDEMKSGKMIINGVPSRDVGFKMTGGEIMINGDYDQFVIGADMLGGVIRVNGKLSSYLGIDRTSGDIYQYDRLVVKNGKVVK